MNIVFMGTGRFGVPALRALLDSKEHKVKAVFTSPPKPHGRGMKIQKSPIYLVAEEYNVSSILTPISLKKNISSIKHIFDVDAVIVVSYGLIIPKSLLQLPKFGFINIHPSKLPRYRGPSPIQHTILEGDTSTGICIMQMDEGVDTGPILKQSNLRLSGKENFLDLEEKLSCNSVDLLLSVLDNIHFIQKNEQSDIGITYTKKFTKEDGRIIWSDNALAIERQIRALNPFISTYFIYNNEKIKVLESIVIDSNSHDYYPGTVIDDQCTIACAQGTVRFTKLTRPGKKMTTGQTFINGISKLDQYKLKQKQLRFL